MDRNTPFTFEHFVDFKRDGVLFCSGRESKGNRRRLFLIHQQTGRVYSRSGNQWNPVDQDVADVLKGYASRAEQHGIPCYTTNAQFSN